MKAYNILVLRSQSAAHASRTYCTYISRRKRELIGLFIATIWQSITNCTCYCFNNENIALTYFR